MTLASMVWTEITINNVVSEFLRGERHRYDPTCFPVIDNPNLSDPLENHQRMRLLYLPRAIFWIEVPLDTKWYEVAYLTESELDELYVSARHNPEWDRAGNKLDQVSAVAKEPLKSPPDSWARIILWGHDKTGPFSIIEGCHRMLGYAHANPRPRLNVPVYVGLSPSYCVWHYADPVAYLGQDLIRH
jgi:hypothetical protein